MDVGLAAKIANVLSEIVVESDFNDRKFLNHQFKQKLYQSMYEQQIFQELTAGNNVSKRKTEAEVSINGKLSATEIRVRTEGARVLRRTGQMKPEYFT